MKRVALSAAMIALAMPSAAAAAPTHPDVSYDIDSPAAIAGNLLDVYEPQGFDGPRPVAVFVHGGAWYAGDKANRTIPDKARAFNDAGYVFVSVNYRLSPNPPQTANPDRVMFPDHPHDVGEAIAWLRRHVAEYGGDPKRFVLLGHSAGAHLVSLVATDGSYLDAYDVGRGRVLGAVSLDTAAFDLRGLGSAATSPVNAQVGWNAFGTRGENAATGSWTAGSPIVHADPDDPPFLFVTRPNPRRRGDNRAMAEALGQDPDDVLVVDLTHEQINAALGDPADSSGETEAVIAFANAVTRVPKAKLTGHPRKRVRAAGRRKRVRFRFKSKLPGATFECRLDGRRRRTCESPKAYRVKPRRHLFKVRAMNGTLKGETEAFRFRVVGAS
jgi:acetyl esterase/lipase